jgi:hypothetical protein
MTTLKSVITVSALAAAATLFACAGGGDTFGRDVPGDATATVAEVMARGPSADGEHVVVEGKVAAVCPTGCWLDVADDAGTVLHVVVAGDFAVPQSLAGKRVRVEGTLRYVPDKGKIEMVADGVKTL